MGHSEEKIIDILRGKGQQLLDQPYKKIEFTKNIDADEVLNNLEDFPHAFVFACIMDRQIKAERAWIIPYEISKEINGYGMEQFQTLSKEQLNEIFHRKSLHRFNNKMSENFYHGIQHIKNMYNSDASKIWRGNPKSAAVVRRFIEFKGISVKIATMAANILARDFKIPFSDHICIDISPDVHVKRVFKRLGLLSKSASNEELLYRAREMNPLYPGIFDLSCWEIGRNWCRPSSPQCTKCYMSEYCPKNV